MTGCGDCVGSAPLVVLIVDDDADVRRLCRTILEREGCRVIEACDGDDVVRIATDAPPDVIIMDVMMPRMDGLEATRSLRANSRTQCVPIIILSAKQERESMAAAFAAGADEYLAKPALPGEILARVRSMARLSRVSAALHRSNEVLGYQTHALMMMLEYNVALASTEDLDEVLDRTVQIAARLTGCRRISIMLPDPENHVLRIRRSTGLETDVAAKVSMRVGEPIAGEVFAKRKRLVINDEADAAAYRDAHDARVFGGLPMLSAPMCVADGVVGVLNVTSRIDKRPFSEQELEYLRFVNHHAASAIQAILARQARDEARSSVVVALAKLAEHRDDDTGKHLERMSMFCAELAREMGTQPEFSGVIDEDFVRNIRRAAPLHDIGKVAIPDSILLKPGKLTPEEMDIMRTHVSVGAETLRSVLAKSPDSAYLRMAEEIAEGHHEWYNGKGYLRGLKGDEIPLTARIAALADVYDALTTKRVYKEAMPHEKAKQIITAGSGTQFDPRVVAAFLRSEQPFIRLAQALADDQGEIEAPPTLPAPLLLTPVGSPV